jgi:hypothetical protein
MHHRIPSPIKCAAGLWHQLPTGIPGWRFYLLAVTLLLLLAGNATAQDDPLPVTPFLECVRVSPDLPNYLQATWGYNNPNNFPVLLIISEKNYFSPPPASRGQPIVFNPGMHRNAVTAVFPANNTLSWNLDGQIATASAAPELRCPGFTFQGLLDDDLSPVNGEHNFEFSLWDDPVEGTQIGQTLVFDGNGSNPPPIMVTDGLFTVELDFGPDIFAVNPRVWLAITVDDTPLLPRKRITPAPGTMRPGDSPPVEVAWRFVSTGGTQMHIQNINNGFVGIGDITPTDPLTVNGVIRSASGGFEFPDGSIQTTAVTKTVVASATGNAHNFGNIGAGARASAEGSLPGAMPGDVVVISVNGDVPFPFILFGAYCPAPNKYRFLFQNLGSSAADPPAFTVDVVAIRP